MVDQQSATVFHTCMVITFTSKESGEKEAIGAEMLAQQPITPHGLVSSLMAFLCFHHSTELPPAHLPTLAQEYVDLFKENFLKSRFTVWQRRALYKEHALFCLQVKHAQCLSGSLIVAQLFAYGVVQAPKVPSRAPSCVMRHPNASGSSPRILRVQESVQFALSLTVHHHRRNSAT